MARYTQATIPEGIRPRYRHNHTLEGRIFCTVCQLLNSKGETVAHGTAWVSEKEKHPSKRIGRYVSLGRALKALDEKGGDS